MWRWNLHSGESGRYYIQVQFSSSRQRCERKERWLILKNADWRHVTCRPDMLMFTACFPTSDGLSSVWRLPNRHPRQDLAYERPWSDAKRSGSLFLPPSVQIPAKTWAQTLVIRKLCEISIVMGKVCEVNEMRWKLMPCGSPARTMTQTQISSIGRYSIRDEYTDQGFCKTCLNSKPIIPTFCTKAHTASPALMLTKRAIEFPFEGELSGCQASAGRGFLLWMNIF